MAFNISSSDVAILPNCSLHLRLLKSLTVGKNGLRGGLPQSLLLLRKLASLSASHNKLSSSLPHGLESLQSMQSIRADKNRLDGSLPESIAFMRPLEAVSIFANHMRGAIPIGIQFLVSISLFAVSANRFSGAQDWRRQVPKPQLLLCQNIGKIPDSVAHLRQLYAFQAGRNMLSGAIPAGLASAVLVETVNLAHNSFSSTLPEGLMSLTAISDLRLGFNQWLSGTVPAGMRSFKDLVLLGIQWNRFRGTIQDAFGPYRRLQELSIESNDFAGAIPSVFGSMLALRTADVTSNRFNGAFPRGMLPLRLIETLQMGQNNFRGTLPVGLASMQLLQDFIILDNHLSGTLPDGMAQLYNLRLIAMSGNLFSGTIPDCVRSWQALSVMGVLDNNVFSGALPAGIGEWSCLRKLHCGRNMWEGTVPDAIVRLSRLTFLGMAGAGHQDTCMQGSIPPAVGSAQEITTMLFQGHAVEGRIPAFVSTFEILALHHNFLESVHHLHLRKNSRVLLHRNRLSCKLPAGNTSQVKVALVAMGNHLTHPARREEYPAWVLPFERDGLFWIDAQAGRWLMLKTFAGFLLMAVAVHQHLHMTATRAVIATSYRRQRRALNQQAMMWFSFMAKHALLACLLLMLLLCHCDFYVCPATLALASACLSGSSWIRTMVSMVSSWSLLKAKSWIRQKRRRVPSMDEDVVISGLKWASWILIVFVMSSVAIVDAVNMCTPASTPFSTHSIGLIHLGVGALQAVVSGAVIPYAAGKFGSDRKSVLVGTACILNSCLIPGLVVMYLDGACLDRWTSFWAPCTHTGNIFDVRAQIQDLQHGFLRMTVMRRDDVCAPSPKVSPAACARSIALKLQGVLLSKLVVTALVLPALRLLLHWPYETTQDVLTKLALFVELGLLLGPCLPLMAPMLCFGILSERLLALASMRSRDLHVDAKEEDLRVALILTCVCSVVFYSSFLSRDVLAWMLFVVALMGIAA